MKADQWPEVERIFNEVVELPPEEWPAYLDRTCGNDASLRREIETLLACDERALKEQFLDEGLPARESIREIARAIDKVFVSSQPPKQPIAELVTDNQNKKQILANRFTIDKFLGEGGFGAVFQVFDQEQQTPLALKILRQDNADALLRFKREFRALADITHPNLVTLYELSSAEKLWYFTMELIEGVNFLEYVGAKLVYTRDCSTEIVGDISTVIDSIVNIKSHTKNNEQNNTITQHRPNTAHVTLPLSEKSVDQAVPNSRFSLKVDYEKLRAALTQLVTGLAFLHNAGKLHCDIKPSNVLVTNDGRLVILDFGLVTELIDADRALQEFIFGTPAYMSPEQAARQVLTPATDFYSLGVILYEALTGSLPFSGPLSEIISKKQQFDPPPPSQINSAVPADLDRLCQQLLNRDPQLRPTAAQILKRLTQHQQGLEQTGPTTTIIDQTHITSAIVGRAPQLEALERAYIASRALSVFVQGRSGMGKTALVRHFLDNLQQLEPQTLILAGRCYEQESVPYKALDSVIDMLSHYLKTLSNDQLLDLLPTDFALLSRLFPVLKLIPLDCLGPSQITPPDPQELRRRAFAALKELITRLAGHKRLVIFIDDLHWGDVDSAALLVALLGQPAPPLLFIGSYRSEEIEISPLLKHLFAIPAALMVERQDLLVNELSPDAAIELTLAQMQQFCSPTDRGVEQTMRQRAAAIASESGGNPLFIDAMVRYSSSIPPVQEKPEIIYDTRLDEVIAARVENLPKAVRRLLEVIAIAGQPIKRQTAYQAAKMESEELTALSLLRAQHLVRARANDEKSEIEIYHDQIRTSIIKYLPLPKRQGLHLRLALVLEESGQADPELLISHFQAAGKKNKATRYLVLAADQAASALAFDRAARLYRMALDLSPQQDQLAIETLSIGAVSVYTIKLKLAETLVNAGRGAEAAEVFLSAATLGTRLESLECRRRAAEQSLFSGNIEAGIAQLRGVLNEIGMDFPNSSQGALISLITQRAQLHWRGLRFNLQKESEIAPDLLTRVDTCWSAALGLSMVDNIRAADFQSRHLLIALRVGEPYRIARALALECGYSASGGGRNQTQTAQIIEMARKMARDIDNSHALALLQLNEGIAAALSGQWLEGRKLIEGAEQLLSEKCTGVTWELNTARYFHLLILGWLGSYQEILQRLPLLLKDAKDRNDLYASTTLQVSSFLVYLAADQPDKVLQTANEIPQNWSQQGFHIQHLWSVVDRIHVALYREDGPTAWQLINDHWPYFKKNYLLRIQFLQINLLHLRALSALTKVRVMKDQKPLLSSAERDAKQILKENVAWGNGLAKAINAAVAIQRRQPEKALPLMIEAAEIFHQTGMLIHKAIVNRRRGQLIGGDNGRALIESAERELQAQQILNYESFSELIAPALKEF